MKESLLDVNMNKKIAKCHINEARYRENKIFVIYEDGSKEYIWTYNPYRYEFNYKYFIGKTKLQVVTYCDQKAPRPR